MHPSIFERKKVSLCIDFSCHAALLQHMVDFYFFLHRRLVSIVVVAVITIITVATVVTVVTVVIIPLLLVLQQQQLPLLLLQ